MKPKLTKMDVFATKLYNLTELVYELIKNSFFFWCYLLRGFGAITLLASIKSLAGVSLDIVHKERKPTRLNYKENYHNTDRKRFQSLLIFFLLLYLTALTLLPFPTALKGSMWYGLKYLALFIVVIGLLLLVTKPIFEILLPEAKWTISTQIYFLIKGAKWSILLLAGMLAVLWFSLQNVIFLVGFAPGILGILSAAIGEKMVDLVFGSSDSKRGEISV